MGSFLRWLMIPLAAYVERFLLLYANTQAMTSAFKRDILKGFHNLEARTTRRGR